MCCPLVEPIGGSKPKFSVVTDYSHSVLHNLSLNCPAQGSPVPTFRFVPFKFILFEIEPIGGSAPKFSGVSDLSRLIGKASHPQTLSCPAQGSPIPTFR